MATYLRLHAPGPADRGPNPKCKHPNKCSYNNSFRCGDTPQEENSLCSDCQKADSLEAESSRGVIIIDL